MKIHFSLLILSLCFCISSYTQSPCVKQAAKLQTTIHYYFYNSDITKSAKNRKQGPSELFLCFLEIDSLGKVGNISLLADQKNKDSAYEILSKLQPTDFKNWVSDDCKGKTIMIPIIMIGPEDKPGYVSDLYRLQAFKRGENKNLIMLSGINLYWPDSKE